MSDWEKDALNYHELYTKSKKKARLEKYLKMKKCPSGSRAEQGLQSGRSACAEHLQRQSSAQFRLGRTCPWPSLAKTEEYRPHAPRISFHTERIPLGFRFTANERSLKEIASGEWPAQITNHIGLCSLGGRKFASRSCLRPPHHLRFRGRGR